jgi:branched-chain amino acid transport system ATP-binding protein
VLDVRNLKVKYGTVEAVSDVSLSVREGQIVALLGANGAGKSTTLHSVAGAVRPSRGDVVFEGTSLAGMRPEKIVRQGLALVPEGRWIFERMTVEENLRLGATPRRDRVQITRDLEEIFGRFPVLGRYRRSNAGKLSGGEQQQLAIARALLGRPRLLMLDEPSLGLAPLVVKEIFAMLTAMQKEGITVLLVEQYARSALRIADYVYVLAYGAVSKEGDPSQFTDTSEIEQSYLGCTKEAAP